MRGGGRTCGIPPPARGGSPTGTKLTCCETCCHALLSRRGHPFLPARLRSLPCVPLCPPAMVVLPYRVTLEHLLGFGISQWIARTYQTLVSAKLLGSVSRGDAGPGGSVRTLSETVTPPGSRRPQGTHAKTIGVWARTAFQAATPRAAVHHGGKWSAANRCVGRRFNWRWPAAKWALAAKLISRPAGARRGLPASGRGTSPELRRSRAAHA